MPALSSHRRAWEWSWKGGDNMTMMKSSGWRRWSVKVKVKIKEKAGTRWSKYEGDSKGKLKLRARRSSMAPVVISLSATVNRIHEDLQPPFGTAIIQHRPPRSCTSNVSTNREESANVRAKAADGGAAAEGPTAASQAAEFAAAVLRRDLRGGGQNVRL
ncbi:hypothetical protein BU17DRAFT_68629 [Hysterangium stoloniferum]|nr:hypothetical protein BU17DRAFT_68629 [Hysterangium stoloniferum]